MTESLSSNPRALIENLVGYVKETTDHPGFVKALQAIELALSPAAKFDDLKKQCQCLWRTDATLVCRLPKGHEGDHREGAFTWNGEVDTRTAHEPTSARASNEQLAQALRNLRDVAHREVSPRYSAALDEAFTLADIALGEFDSEGDVSREADVGPGGGVRATHATGSAPSKPGAAEPPSARLLIECAEAMEENCEHEGKLSTFVDLARRCRAAAGERYCLCPPGGWVSNCPAHKLPNRAAPTKDAPRLCPHGMPLEENICGPCSQGRPNRRADVIDITCDEDDERVIEFAFVLDDICVKGQSVTKDAGECGACDKPGEHCANVHGICSRHGGRAHEPSAGVKCTHCNGTGYSEPIYDEQDGWIDETPCETCNGSGRITTVEQYLKTLPANWHEDSSLETWFPITAEELKRLKDARATVPPSASREQQLLTELAYWKARCGVMHGDETNAVTKSVTVPVLPTSEEDERIVDAAIKRRLSGETSAALPLDYPSYVIDPSELR